MKKNSFLIILVLFCLLSKAQKQAGMVDKPGGGQVFSAEQYKIDRMKMQSNTSFNPNPNSYKPLTEFDKPKKGINAKGEIWIDGYCRFRPATYSKSHYSDMSEVSYLSARYPPDTFRFTDNFDGKGTIFWDLYKTDKSDGCKDLNKLASDSLKEALPLPVFQKLLRCSGYFGESNSGGEYEFSRAVKIWVKRMSGPEKEYLEFRTQYDFTNGDDNTILKINDKGSFEITDNCSNCKHTKNELKDGKAKSWIEGGWNELTISKNEFNTVRIYVNEELIFQYQVPDIPVATRYSSFWLELPYEWQKKKLMYNIGQITVECYPRMKQ